MDASTQRWGAHMGNSQISGTWACTDLRHLINCLVLKSVMLTLYQDMIATDYGQHNSSVLYHQTGGGDSLPLPATSSNEAIPVASISGHSYEGQAHSWLSQCDSRLPVLIT